MGLLPKGLHSSRQPPPVKQRCKSALPALPYDLWEEH
jgi:hypothetical protein